MKSEKIVRVLSFNKESRTLFPYINDYLCKFEEWITKNQLTEDIIKRFILVSFWLDYQSSIQKRNNFTIKKANKFSFIEIIKDIGIGLSRFQERYPRIDKMQIKLVQRSNIQFEKNRLKIYFKFFNKPIMSSKEYASLINCGQLENIGDCLFLFVTEG